MQLYEKNIRNLKCILPRILISYGFQENASERARKIFGELDVNGDGELDCEEFVKGCMEDKDLLQTLNGGDVKEQDGQRKRGSTNHKTNLQFEL